MNYSLFLAGLLFIWIPNGLAMDNIPSSDSSDSYDYSRQSYIQRSQVIVKRETQLARFDQAFKTKDVATLKELETENPHLIAHEFTAAATRDDMQAVKLFLEAKISPNTKNAAGLFPLFCTQNHLIVDTLVAHKADLDAKGPKDVTSLMRAFSKGNYSVAKTLLESGANPNIAMVGGRTPLMEAIRGSYLPEDGVNILLLHGADLSLRDEKGRTAFSLVDHYWEDCPEVQELKQVLSNALMFRRLRGFNGSLQKQ